MTIFTLTQPSAGARMRNRETQPPWRAVLATTALATLAACSDPVAPLGPDGLTDAERASVSQRGLTDEERALRAEGCARPPLGEQAPEFASYGRAHIVDFPETQYLKYLQLRRTAPGRSAIDAFPGAPNGGIGGKDLCQAVRLETVDRSALLRTFTVHTLRRGIDIARDYPAFAQVVAQNDQIITTPRSRHVIIFPPDGTTPEQLAERLRQDPRVDQSGYYIVYGSSVFMPLK
ncbi:MAG: hypothetical protein AAGE76_14435 [Pseudomonadota bacterium]